ncbi:DEAD/DEAH box helicase [uncultured Holdemanella sp.]|uniref:DEAD/DEAH box helicase n=1 Tax=uncultured Holdemanella sp. TaxID=1763549 RepID=UPI0025CED817|nr:DEAD/DEAH box helicase [uncultured Holdemanella sp.]
MHIYEESLNRFIKNSWIYYEANDPYYAGKIERISIERVHDKILYYEVRAIVQTRWNEEILNFRVNEYGTILTTNCTCCQDPHSGCVHLVSVVRAINAINPQTFPFHVDYQNYVKEKNRQEELERKRRRINDLNQVAFEFLKEKQEDKVNSFFKENENLIRLSLYHTNSYYYDQIAFKLKIQVSRAYTVKNIQDLLRGFFEKRLESFGKNTQIYLTNDDLDEPSQLIYNFLLKYAFTKDWQKEGEIYSECSDDFFNLNASLPKEYTEFKTSKKNIKLVLNLLEHEDCFELNTELDDSFLIGNKHLYMVNHKEIVQYTMDPDGFLASLAYNLQQNDGWLIKKSEFKAFYLQCLQPYMEYIKLETNVDVEKYTTLIENIRVYSDLENANMVVWGTYLENNQKKSFFTNTNSNQIASVEAIIQHYAVKIEDNKAIFKGRSDALYNFLDYGIPLIQKQADVYVSEELKRLKNRRSMNLSVKVYVQNDLLKMELDSNVNVDELSHILNAYRKKKKFYQLKNGEMIDLENTGLEQLDELASTMNLTTKDFKKETIEKPAYQAFHLMDVNPEFDVRNDVTVTEYTNRLMNIKKQPIQLKDEYKSLLRMYQQQGIQWLYDLKNMNLNGILADDMGLGKTLQVLVFYEQYVSKEKPSLIVCPSSLMYNWMSEIEKFKIDVDAVCVTGTQDVRKDIIKENHELYITTYDYLRRDVELYMSMEFEYIVLDEAQFIKNPKTKNAQSVKSLKSKHRLALTGTPIENGLSELWSIFDFLLPGYLYSLNYFTKNFEKPIQMGDDKRQAQLQKLVSPFILRRTKKQVLKDLPDKVEKDLWLNLSPEEKQLYLANLAQVNEQLQQQLELEKVDSILILAMMTRLRQICCEPRMLYENYTGESTKFKMCLDLIETLKENDKKVLLFSSFTSIFDSFIEEFNRRGIKYHMITGAVDKKKRKEEVDAFQSDDSNVFLISLKAGGTGLNLTKAQAVIHFDPWWNVSAQNQATDRAYRIGQTKNVLVYQLLMKNTIEEKIYEMQKRKKAMSDLFVENSKGGISTLSKEELKDLFSMD